MSRWSASPRREAGKARSTHWKLHALQAFASNALPPELEVRREEIVADLAQALQAYGEDGLVGPRVQHTLTLTLDT
ncbi:hypothetical protein ACFFGH_02680 [Lysobacter korlensis]|uniref:Uncharacterized protein n=1 Tax=Lysobacter korlensis TaxID=553636 RepID=A0ABV6RIF1_9GAMM